MKLLYGILMIFTASLLLLTGCANDLPPEPNAPGVTGNYYKAVGEWATEPISFKVTPESISCDTEDDVDITLEVFNEDYVYNEAYIWLETDQEWERVYFQGEQIGNWIRGDATLTFDEDCDDLVEDVADENGEVFFVAYSCSKVDGAWDCHDNKWQVQVVNVSIIEEPKLTCVEDGNGNIELDGYVVTEEIGNDFVYVNGSNKTKVSLIFPDPNDAYAPFNSLSEGDFFDIYNGDSQQKMYVYKILEINALTDEVTLEVISVHAICDDSHREYWVCTEDNFDDEYETCMYGCEDGACVKPDLPEEPPVPGGEVGFTNATSLFFNSSNWAPQRIVFNTKAYTFALRGFGTDCVEEVGPFTVLNLDDSEKVFVDEPGVYNFSSFNFIVHSLNNTHGFKQSYLNMSINDEEYFFNHSKLSSNTSYGELSIFTWMDYTCTLYEEEGSLYLQVNELSQSFKEGASHTFGDIDVLAKDITIITHDDGSYSMISEIIVS